MYGKRVSESKHPCRGAHDFARFPPAAPRFAGGNSQWPPWGQKHGRDCVFMNQDNSKSLALTMISRYVLLVGFILVAVNYSSGKLWGGVAGSLLMILSGFILAWGYTFSISFSSANPEKFKKVVLLSSPLNMIIFGVIALLWFMKLLAIGVGLVGIYLVFRIWFHRYRNRVLKQCIQEYESETER